MTERALSFGTVAAAYERFRLGYPDALVDSVLAYAERPVRTALEIGAGTGKATRAFAARGIAVTATEPDAGMLAELVRHVPDTVTTRQCAFEEFEPGEPYDLVYAAAALHWTRPEGRWERVATLLVDGGVFASFGGPIELADQAVDAEVRAVMRRYGIDERVPSPDGTPDDADLQWPGTELERHTEFEDVRQHVISRRIPMSAADYVGHLSTVSAFLCQPAETRNAALAEVTAVLPATVVVDADLVVHLSRVRTRARGR